MLPQDQLLKPDDLTSLVLSEHIMNDNNDSSQGGMRYPMMPQMEPQPGTVDPTFTVPEWPRPDMGMEARNFPNLRAGLPELPNQMLFDGKAAGGILSPPTAFSNLPNNFFKMESNPYNTTLDFNVLNNYPAVDGQNGAGYPMDGFYNPYTAGLYENNPYAESYDCMNYGSQAPFNAGLIAQAQKPKQKNGKKQPKSKKSKGKPSWAEDASGGGSNSKRLRRNWTDDEERKFLEALEMYGRDWHKCAAHLQSRDVVSCRSHAQKYFIKLWINGEPLPKKVAEQGAGYTVSGKPLDPDSSFVKYYMSLFDKRRQGSISRNSSKSSVDESTAVSAS
jgi:SHAQKYF class myb-like DNA-binding protein